MYIELCLYILKYTGLYHQEFIILSVAHLMEKFGNLCTRKIKNCIKPQRILIGLLLLFFCEHFSKYD